MFIVMVSQSVEWDSSQFDVREVVFSDVNCVYLVFFLVSKFGLDFDVIKNNLCLVFLQLVFINIKCE